MRSCPCVVFFIVEFVKKILGYLQRNALGQPEGAWFDREQGEGLYAEPKNELLQSASGSWKSILTRVMEHLSKGGKSSVDDIVRSTGASRYEAENLRELFKKNTILTDD